MHPDIQKYNDQQVDEEHRICQTLADFITSRLPEAESKVWHGHPVWFLANNPVVGYSKQKAGIRLMFWSGADFEETELQRSQSGKFKDASIFYNHVDEINHTNLERWLEKSKAIQWDYKNIVKNKGVLERMK